MGGAGDVVFGPAVNGVRFGIVRPASELEAGGTIILELVCENGSREPIRVFGFAPRYPRTLRVSPPKTHRPYIRVSFGDTAVLHPPEAFVTIPPGGRATTGLDLSFAFDRRGAGLWPVAFAYDPVRASGRAAAFHAPEGVEALTGVVDLVITAARSLREHGIDEATESRLDAALFAGSAELLDLLRRLGEGGAAFAARRTARLLTPGAESTAGFRALDAVTMLGEAGLRAIQRARTQLPHAEQALAFAEAVCRHRRGDPPPPEHLAFVSMLDRLIEQPGMRGNFLLSWVPYDLEIHGSRRLDVLGSGERIVTSRAPGAPMGITRRSMLGSMQMQALMESLRFACTWLLTPMRGVGLPDEPRPALEVQLALGEPFARRVIMWNGEWRMGPAAQLADLLDRLAADAGAGSAPPGSWTSIPPSS